MRGGEKVLEAIAELFPEAPIYTLFSERKNLSPLLQSREIHTSFLQFIPGISKWYRWLLPLFPLAVYFLDVCPYDLVISSSHCVAKAARIKKGGRHICYCHTPMRYLWGFEDDYLRRFPQWLRWIVTFYFKWLRTWDVTVSQKVDLFIANSNNTADKIRRFYGKEAVVIHPPADVPQKEAVDQQRNSENYFLVVSALVPYKRIELAIEAFNQLKLPLKIVGDGPLKTALQKMIRFKGIELEGWLDKETLWNRYANCRALIFPGEEDFGIVPVEAQSFGKPVIAFGKGGIQDTVVAFQDIEQQDEKKSTGIFFDEQTAEALINAIRKFEQLAFDAAFIQNHAQKFGRDRFKLEFASYLRSVLHPQIQIPSVDREGAPR